MPRTLRNRMPSAQLAGLRRAGPRARPSGLVPEEPLRAELFSVDQLEQHAKALAGWHQVDERPGPTPLLERLEENEAILVEAYGLVAAAVQAERRISPAGEWLLDNFYLIEEQIRMARRHLPRGYSRQLPRLTSGPRAGAPRVYDLALELISHVDGRLDSTALTAFVASYQTVTTLKLGELWAIPIMLRLALIENLRRVASRVAAGRTDRDRANRWADELLAVSEKNQKELILVVAEIVKADPPLTSAFVAEFTRRLQGQSLAMVFPLTWLEQRLTEEGQTVEQLVSAESQKQAADQVSIGNSINSLRFLSSMDWRTFVESLSAVEQALRADPPDVYVKMDFASRDQYRHVVEQIARHTPASELDVAREAVALAREALSQDGARAARRAHVGYYLVDQGRERLERVVGVRPSPGVMLQRLGRRFPFPLYAGGILLVTLLIAAGLLAIAAGRTQPWGFWLLAVPVLLAASRAGVAIVNWLAMRILRPWRLARMNFESGVPTEARTLIAVPTLIASGENIDRLLDALEVYYLANRDPSFHFGLVTDFPDAAQESRPGDEELLRQVSNGIALLNEKYEREDLFFLFHRPRRWNAQEGVWMGWERKRGKIEELNALLRGRSVTSTAARGTPGENPQSAPETAETSVGPCGFATVIGHTDILPNVRYVITLDADTQLPRDAARELVSTIAHPLNRACFDPQTGRVTEGYSILQPRVETTLQSLSRSRYAQIYGGDAGIDPYTRMVSDVYQDAFAEGSFIGKGIYDVDAFEQACGGRFPENRILSHDLLEGAYARAGLVSDVTVLEDYPATYAADVSRRHRWIRGDWQILPWVLARVPGADGARERNPISALSRWKIFDNLRRSLASLALLALLLAGWGLGLGTGFTFAVLMMLVIAPILDAIAQLFSHTPDLPLSLHLRRGLQNAAHELLHAALDVWYLPHDAWISIDAIFRTSVRVLVTRRKLLEWRTACETEARVSSGRRATLAGYYQRMWIAPAAGLLVVFAAGHAQGAAAALAAAMAALWLTAPTAAWLLSRPIPPPPPELGPADIALLGSIARRTWRYFEAFVVQQDNYLPPDNFQEHPVAVIAHRTSPTNIGMALASNLAAYDLGYLSVPQLLDRTRNTLTTLDKLERFRGQFYNWYDTRTLEPLAPLYVSTVDSGNLAASLLILRAGLLEIGSHPIVPERLMAGLLDTLGVLLDAARGQRPRAFEKPAATHLPVRPEAMAQLERMADELRQEPRTLSSMYVTLQRLSLSAAQFATAHDAHPNQELKWWSRAFERHTQEAYSQLVYAAPWVTLPPPTEHMWRRGSPLQADRLADLRALLRQLEHVPDWERLTQLEATLLPSIALIQSDLRTQQPTAPPDESDWFNRLFVAITEAGERATQRLDAIERLAEQCEDLADLNYDFLYDRSRHLLSIGYQVSDHRRDNSYYDLLASEARLVSFIGIAQGKLPQDNWFALGRALTKTDGEVALLSWSGSLFEYLMPLLIMPTFPRTLLDETYHAVVRRQIEYGRHRGVPWGISESGYSATDLDLNYQYRAFGVPGLGLKRGLADDLVIAPYASALGLMVKPGAACANLRSLAAEGFLSDFGFYEALDFTSSRLRRGRRANVVRSWMAHHQGMSLLALDYVLMNQPMQKRFFADPLFRATELLLQERVPRIAPIYPHAVEATLVRRSPAESEAAPARVLLTPNTPSPEVHLLSNGRYHVMVTAAGGGYSRWTPRPGEPDLAITRWREDATRDCWGTFCYVREPSSGEFWSIAHQPTLRRGRPYEAIFSQARAEFRRRDHGIAIHTEIAVSPEDDIELRRVAITNHSRVARTIELTSYAEVVLAPAPADAAHPVFGKLFVQTEIIRTRQAILCTRRPRSEHERPPWMIHLMTVQTGGDNTAPPGVEPETSYETNRALFVGRGQTLLEPRAMHVPRLSDSQGAVLDPIVSVRRTITLEPDSVAYVNIVTGAAETREIAMFLIDKYHDPRLADRVFELAWTHSQVVLRQLDATAAGASQVTESDAQAYSRLASSVIYANPAHRAVPSIIARNRRGQSGLWGYGISGDLPIVLLRVGKISEIELVRQMVQAHAYWRLKGLAVDLVIWNEDQSGYRQELQDRIIGLIASGSEAPRLDRPGGIFVRRNEQISEEDRLLLPAVARVVITDKAGTLAEQLDRRTRTDIQIARFVPTRPRRPDAVQSARIMRRDLAYFNGLGGFTRDGREYIIHTFDQRGTPAPWSNVIANPQFGTVVTECGGGYTWYENAHELRLTPWYNDPVVDASGEAFYVRDEESGRFWSPMPLPVRGAMPYTTRHGFGYSVFEYSEEGIRTELTVYVAMDAPVKFWRFKVRNDSGRTRRISLTGYVEWVLGEHRDKTMMHIVTESDARTGAMLARNAFNSELAGRVAFFDVSEPQRTVTANRADFLGRNGSTTSPAAMQHASLSGKVGAALDPCAAMMTLLELGTGQEREITFMLGAAGNIDDARRLLERFRGNAPAYRALEGVWNYWNRTLGAVYVETPEPSINYLVNGWLLYQTLSCRMWGRSGYYQSGGAYGFRDQLQDSLALMYCEPRLIREHILRCAAHQFRQGDVQHWWHPPTGRGVRTRFSDDYLWLPYVVAHYVESIGDTGILDEKVHYIEGRALNAGEESYYDLPTRSEEVGTIFDHCVRAINYGLKFGDRGLPLMGCGDWNDGMNLVGIQGRGESVWLAFFLHDVLDRFSEIAEDRGDADLAGLYREQRDKLHENVERHAWDGQWYTRAFFDNGEPLGSASSQECRIDALPQSWAVIAGAGEPARCATALARVDEHLVRRDLKLIQLFDPPFDQSPQNPGYIKGYPPGVRENGGQYTHAAIWTVMGFALHGEVERAWELLSLINPVHHGSTEQEVRTYGVEPYVVAADVYTNPQHPGRGGWTWYTGSAGWMYRLIVGTLLGVRLQVDRLLIEPRLPKAWKAIKIHYRYHETFYHIEVKRIGEGDAVRRVLLDGSEVADLQIRMLNDRKEHQALIELGH